MAMSLCKRTKKLAADSMGPLERSQHHFVTESVQQGEKLLKWVPTNDQQADIFTKALAAPVFLQSRRQLMTQ